MVLYSVLTKEHLNCIRHTARNNKLQKDRKNVEDVCRDLLHLSSIVTRIHAARLGNGRSVLDRGKSFLPSTAPKPTSSPIFPKRVKEGKCCRNTKLTFLSTHLSIPPKLRLRGVIPPLLQRLHDVLFNF